MPTKPSEAHSPGRFLVKYVDLVAQALCFGCSLLLGEDKVPADADNLIREAKQHVMVWC